MRFSTLVVVGVILGLPAVSHAQIAPHVDATVHHAPPLPRTPINRAALTLESAAIAFDYATTAHWLGLNGSRDAAGGTIGTWETNPLLGRHPSDARLAAFGLAEDGAAAIVLARTERSSHAWVRWAGRAAVAAQIVAHVRGGVHNLGLADTLPGEGAAKIK